MPVPTDEERRIAVDFSNVWREITRMEGSTKQIAEYAYRQGRAAGKADGLRLTLNHSDQTSESKKGPNEC